jgi:hypothetical protein
VRKDLTQFIKDLRAAQRRSEIVAGTLTKNRATTIPDKKKQQDKYAARGRVQVEE